MAAPPKPSRRLTKEARRAQLIAAAETVFSEVGYGNATMEQIAERDGVARSLLYEHFASIDAIYVECHRTAREELQERVFAAAALATDPAAPDGNLEGQLRAGLVAYFTYFDQRPQRFDLLYGPGGPGGPLAEHTAELRFITAERIAALFAAAAPHVPEHEAMGAAHIISGGAEQLARWWHRNPDLAIDTVADGLMAVVWPGMQRRLDEPTA